jgi:ergothioneine biosynthesis protein EgtB
MNQTKSNQFSMRQPSFPRNELIEQFVKVRQKTTSICQYLETDDLAVQPCDDVSPPKWHLAHTTWFFEEMILRKFSQGYERFNPQYKVLFNSYYKSAGQHWLQGQRGHLSRPTVDEILTYRKFVDGKVLDFLDTYQDDLELDFLLEIGLHHEQQHQELLHMDIKYILGMNPLAPQYSTNPLPAAKPVIDRWMPFEEGVYEIGHNGEGFAFDNEGPRHKTYIHPFSMCENFVTNRDYLEFVQAGGYTTPQLWLSQGWDWVESHKVSSPLYWSKDNDQWKEFTLHGSQNLDPLGPVTHLSYFEADAFANWTGFRLPTEQESELFLQALPAKTGSEEDESIHPTKAASPTGQAWWWTRSHYSPYPGYRTFEGPLGEYNGKFMCNQFVLKGGCVATAKNHNRPSYRNFYQPHQRWMFSGLRLAKDL